MYFIKKGLVAVLATDNKTVIAYMSEGSYFGEIGCLLSGTRSCYIKAKSPCVLMAISKENLIEVLEKNPEANRFLKAVGRQRMLTTDPEDISKGESDNTSESDPFKSAMGPILEAHTFNNHQSVSAKSIRHSLTADMEISGFQKFLRGISYTKFYPSSEDYVIIPFSILYTTWMFLLISACAYTYFIVPFSLAYEVPLNKFWLIPIDVAALLIFAGDILISVRIALNKDKEVTLDKEEIFKDYIDTRFLLDFISMIPLDYILWSLGASWEVMAYARFIRFFKFVKIADYITIIRKHTNFKIALFTLFLLSIAFLLIAHMMGCMYFFIGRHEVYKGRRYDK